MYYLEQKVTTASRTAFETPTIFPKVSICNVKPFTTGDSVEYLREGMNKIYNPKNFYGDLIKL